MTAATRAGLAPATALLLVTGSALAQAPATAPADGAAQAPTTTVTGQLRFRGELFEELDFDDSIKNPALDNRRVLSRARVRVDAAPVEDVTLVVQLQDSRLFGSEPSTASSAASVGLHQGYVRVDQVGGSVVDLFVGRQHLSYGDQRLVGAFDWSNTGRSFDAVRARVRPTTAVTVDVFGARIHDARDGARSLGDDFAGTYATWKADDLTVDGYVLYLHDSGGTIDTDGDGTPDADRFPGGGSLHLATIGARVDGRFGAIGVNAEAAGQFGERGDLSVLAVAAHARAGYTLDTVGAPELQLGGAFASGDSDATDDDFGTFENLFPTNHLHYGYADIAAWKNLVEIYGKVAAVPADGWKTILAVHALLRASTDDFFFRASGVGYGPGAASDARYVGTDIDLFAKWKANGALTFLGGLSYVLPGGYLDDAAGGDATGGLFGYLQMQGDF